MRALVVLLLLANLAWLALARGWLQPWVGLSSAHEREPQRLAAQLNADAVRVVRPVASKPDSAPVACLQAGPFDAAQLEDAEAALARLPAGSWHRVEWPLGTEATDPGRPARHGVRVDAADAAMQRQLQALNLPGGFVACPSR